MDQLSLILFSFLFAYLLFTQISLKNPSPVLAILNRWLRWFFFSLCGALFFTDTGISTRPFWHSFLLLALIWLLVETVYNWLIIRALSMSELPLFPRFEKAGQVPNIPARQARPLLDWLNKNTFKQIQTLKAPVAPNLDLFSIVYQNGTSTLRLQINLIPQIRNQRAIVLAFSTNTSSGQTLITDNNYLPFGGFYPEDWSLERRPWTRSIDKLHKRHLHRLAQNPVDIPTPWTSDPLNDINNNQAELETLNTELGFLVSRDQREEYGAITSAGRFRIWQEYFFLNYFGRTVKYR